MKNNQYRSWSGDGRALSQITYREPAISISQVCLHCQKQFEVTEITEGFMCEGCITELAAFEDMCEREVRQQAWNALQAVPAYVEREVQA